MQVRKKGIVIGLNQASYRKVLEKTPNMEHFLPFQNIKHHKTILDIVPELSSTTLLFCNRNTILTFVGFSLNKI